MASTSATNAGDATRPTSDRDQRGMLFLRRAFETLVELGFDRGRGASGPSDAGAHAIGQS